MTEGRPPEDDERTVIRVPPKGPAFMGHTLPEGTRLEGLEITGLIGEGGFGIVYLAYDASLERKVAIKEYMPSSLAARAGASFAVSVKSERHRETFEAGLKSFVNEARLLARFDHPALVKVFRFWEANRTAYMAMPYYEGPTLKHALAQLGAPPSEALLREWLRSLLDALSVMHKEQCYHRDIAPDNILLTERGPLLLDFGAARRVIGDMTHALTVVLKPGYAPIEQYGEATSMVQGPWTDLYALASVVHYAITGKAPITSVERIMGDRLEPLAVTAAGRYSAGFLHAIDAALAVRPQDRPQDVAQFRELLNAGLPADSPERFHPSGFQSSGFHTSGFSPSSFDAASLDAAPRTAGPQATPTTAPAPRPDPVTVMPPMATRDAPAPGRFGALAYLMAALALGGIGAAWWFTRVQEPAPRTPVEVATPAPAAAARADAPTVAAPAPVETPAVAPAPVPAPAVAEVASQPTPAAAEPAPPPAVEAAAPAPAVERAPEPAARPPAPEPKPRIVPQRPPPAVDAEPAPPRNAGVKPARCSDILQKASLEPLTAEEAAYLKRECR
jgi:serine/threonine protein kinase